MFNCKQRCPPAQFHVSFGQQNIQFLTFTLSFPISKPIFIGQVYIKTETNKRKTQPALLYAGVTKSTNPSIIFQSFIKSALKSVETHVDNIQKKIKPFPHHSLALDMFTFPMQHNYDVEHVPR